MKRWLIFLFFSFLFSEMAWAVTPLAIGKAIFVQGQAAAINSTGNKRVLQRGADLFLHDRIVTEESSKIQLRLHDDSVIVVQPSSEFYVSEFAFDKKSPRNNKYVGNLVKGVLINISGQGDPKNYQLQSPLTTIAFRGTGLATKLIAMNNIAVNQEVYVFQGYVAVTSGLERINIGSGQQMNSALINKTGKIQGMKSTTLLSESGMTNLTDKIITKQGESGIAIKCKGR